MLDRFWELIGYVFALNDEAFRVAVALPSGTRLALLVVLVSGLSQEIGQSIMLFINRVRPARFAISLVINAILFAFGFLALVLSTWLITLAPGSEQVPLSALVTVLGLAYAPLLFSFLGALPYLGVPIMNVLAVWHLLAMVVGFGAIANLSVSRAFGYVVFGWIVLQVLQNTVGRPLAKLGKRIANLAAGTELVTDRRAISATFQETLAQTSDRWQSELLQNVNALQQMPEQEVVSDRSSSDAPVARPTPKPEKSHQRGLGTTAKTLLILLVLVILTVIVMIFLRPLRQWWFSWFGQLPGLVQFLLNLLWISAVGLIVAGLLAPLETLGWWAGWYDDEVNPFQNAGQLAEPIADQSGVKRFIVFLDGIGMSNFEYLPDSEEFLDTFAASLPKDIALIRGILPYSVVNRPLSEDRPLAFLWKYADQLRFANPASILGLLVNIRNLLVVGVSADKRYGPLYNQGIAQVVFNGLMKNGYPWGSSIPVTFIGYSGGGQMSCACAPYLKRALGAPVDVVSLGGVISANINLLKLEHLYHLVGDKDQVERLGPKLFPGRWPMFTLSYWNRAKRRGKVSIISMGPVGHNVPGGILDAKLILPDGRSSLQHTLDTIHRILRGEILPKLADREVKASNYDHFKDHPLLRPETYPLHQRPDPACYVPIADWIGRLILPDKAARFGGVYYEIHHAPPAYESLVGQRVQLTWASDRLTQKFVQAVTQDVHFSAEAEYSSRYGSNIHPVRLNHWLQVDPLESLAGSLPEDLMIVAVEQPEVSTTGEGTTLYIRRQPMEVTGRYYALVQFLAPLPDSDQFQVRHFNRESRAFDGPMEVVSLPPVRKFEMYGSFPSTTEGLENSSYNDSGWYIYGAPEATGRFVVQSLGPRALFRLQPERVVFGGAKAAYRYIRKEAWADAVAQKGKISSVLCSVHDNGKPEAITTAVDEWRVGEQALLLHTYGGIGGNHKEPAAFSPIFFGHFAYGRADVVHDPLADERRFEIRYYQVYTHNADGLIAGTLHWSRYMGDRQRGWIGTRPTCDILLDLDAFAQRYDFDGAMFSPLARTEAYLQAMTARYRIGDGTGGTFVGPANNCSQDSNQALFAGLQALNQGLRDHQGELRDWASQYPEQASPLQHVYYLGKDLKHTLQPFGGIRPDWERNEFNLGSSIEDEPLRNLMMGLGSWRTVLPRKASDAVVRIFLRYGAAAWVLRTNQIGGDNPNIEPIAPITF